MPPPFLTDPARRLTAALERRAAAGLPGPETDACRLVDGAGDGWPGVEIDSYAGHWVVQTRDVPWPAGLESVVPASCLSLWHKTLDQQEKRAPEFRWGARPDGPLTVRECGLTFEVDLTAGYSQGVFLDQRPQRQRMRERLRPGDRVLNLFAYTGAFSVAAAASGAVTTTVDLSRPYLEWAQRNFRLNGLEPDGHFFCRGDTFEWLPRFAKKERTWQGIILDPPTFSRNAGGRVFRVENDLPALVAACLAVLAPGGWMMTSTNHRGLSPSAFRRLVEAGAALARRPLRSATPGRMPPDFTDAPYLKTLWLEA